MMAKKYLLTHLRKQRGKRPYKSKVIHLCKSAGLGSGLHSSTACGIGNETSPISDRAEEVTCKLCLKVHNSTNNK